MAERTRALCPTCGRLIHIRENAQKERVFAVHNDNSRRNKCPQSGARVR